MMSVSPPAILAGPTPAAFVQAGPTPGPTTGPAIVPTPVLMPAPTIGADAVAAIARDLNCPVCEGYNLQECPLVVCAQMREVIRERLAAGQTRQQIVANVTNARELQFSAFHTKVDAEHAENQEPDGHQGA